MSPRHLGLLAFGVLAVSSSAILIRLADAPPFAIAFYRNGMAAAILLPIALLRHRDEFRRMTSREWRVALVAGVALTTHFALWVPSVTLTTVAASTVLVTTGPVWVALLGWLFLKERISARGVAGIGLSLTGALVISGGDFGSSPDALLGDVMALGGAMAAAVYVLGGRNLRPKVSLSTYTGIVYGIATVLLGAMMLATGTPFGGFEPEVWGLFALMTLGPQIGGHTVFNYLLAHLEAVVVAIAVTAEPVGASLLALVFLSERPGAGVLVGGAVILTGVYLAISAQSRRQLQEMPLE